MQDYSYKITNEKDTVSGTVRALSINDAAEQIKRNGWYILELKIKKGNFFENPFGKKSEKMSAFERINFTDHLSAMVAAGTPIRDALEAYSDNREEKAEMIDSISKDIEQGRSLSEAFSRYPRAFSHLYISLVKAGETTGSLDETLEYLSNELRRDNEFVSKIKSMLYYPIIVLVLSMGVIGMVVTLVLPRVVEISKNLTGETPTLTKIVIAVADFITNYGIYLFVFIAILIVGFIYLMKNEKISDNIKSKLLEIPIIGEVLRKYTLVRLFRIIGSSVKYGIPIIECMDSAISVAQTEKYRESLIRIKARISKGASISDSMSFESKKLYPGVIVKTLKGAEKTGSIDRACLRLSVSYELQLDRDLKKLTTMIEPIMIVFLGILVCLIAVAVITPVYQMTQRF